MPLSRPVEHDTYVKKWDDFYSDYRKRCKEEKIEAVHTTPYKKFLKKFLQLVGQKLVNEMFIFQMPYGLGHIRLNELKGCTNGPQTLRVKAWDRHFRYHWDKTLSFFKFKEYRLFTPGSFLQNLRKQKIHIANEDPYSKDLIGFVPNKYNKKIIALREAYSNRKKAQTNED